MKYLKNAVHSMKELPVSLRAACPIAAERVMWTPP